MLHRRVTEKGAILRLDVATTRDEARDLIGAYLYVPDSEAVDLPEGEYFVHQIVGLRVLTTDGEELGTIREVLPTGSNDVYVVRGRRGEVLIPALKDVLQRVDLEAGTLTVVIPPGLMD